jgi:hypothetical protein
VGAAVGLLGNMHPPSAAHLYLLMVSALLLDPAARPRWRRPLLLSAGFWLGIVPYLVQWLAHRGGGPVPVDVVAFREGPELFSWSTCLRLGFFNPACVLPLALAWLGWRSICSPEEKERAAWLWRMIAAAAFWTFFAPPISRLVPAFYNVSLARIQSYWFFLALALSGFLLKRLVSSKELSRKLGGAALAVFLLATAGGGRASELLDLLHRPSGGAGTLWADVGHSFSLPDRKGFLELCAWARRETGKDDLFLFPTDVASPCFRVYAERPLYVTFKDGSSAFVSALGPPWLARWRNAEALYSDFTAPAARDFCRTEGVTYLVREAKEKPVALPVAFENEGWKVYRP